MSEQTVSKWIADNSPYYGTFFHVHTTLSAIADEAGGDWFEITDHDLAKISRRTIGTIRIAKNRFVADEYLEVLHSGIGNGAPSRYRLLFPETSVVTSTHIHKEEDVQTYSQWVKTFSHEKSIEFMIAVEVARIHVTMCNYVEGIEAMLCARDILDLNRMNTVESIIGTTKMKAQEQLHLLIKFKKWLLEYWGSQNETLALVNGDERQSEENK